LCQEFEARHGVKARPVGCDLSSKGELEKLLSEVRGLQLDYLVNNAGFGTAGSFAELPAEREIQMIELNVTAVVRLTREVLTGMVARRRGAILNIGSTAGFQPGPFMATYYATKAFVNSFSEALSYELRGSGVSVTVSCPGPTSTEFGAVSGVDRTRLFQLGTANAASVALEAYRAMRRGRPLVVHGFLNFLLMQSQRIAPRSWVRAITGLLNRAPTKGARS
jgi:short-subunit dehydrogenase